MKLKPTKKEFLVFTVTILCIVLATYFNLLGALLKARDVQRKGDLGAISNGLAAYQADIYSYPASEDGHIVACLGGFDDRGIPQRRKCVWGEEGLRDIFYEDPNYPDYMKTIPQDPKTVDGVNYLYLSNGRHYQLFGHLEGLDKEPEYNPKVVARNLSCGNQICNFGVSDGETPLEKSIEEYENELREKALKNLMELRKKK